MNNIDSIKHNDCIKIIKEYPKDKRYTLAILQDVQREYGFVPRDVMCYVSEYLELPISNIYSITTFYKALSLKSKGKNIIKVCSGTACHIRGSESIKEEILDILGIKSGETTGDGMFSVEVVNCLGACALAPVMVINDKYYGNMTKEKVKAVIDEYKGVSMHAK